MSMGGVINRNFQRYEKMYKFFLKEPIAHMEGTYKLSVLSIKMYYVRNRLFYQYHRLFGIILGNSGGYVYKRKNKALQRFLT